MAEEGLGDEPDRIVSVSTYPQLGLADHYPYEVINLDAGHGLRAGQYCLKISKLASSATPRWLQLQFFDPQKKVVGHRTLSGSMVNPAESNNAGMLSVGASHDSLPSISASYSSRGPVPEPGPRGRVDPDLLSFGAAEYGPITLEGTSFAAPRGAGLASLVIDALGDRQFYDEPDEVVRYLVSRSANGFGRLPPLDPPASVLVEHVPCGVRGNVKWTYVTPTYAGGDSSHLLPKYRVVFELLNDPTMSGEKELVGTGSTHFARFPDGKTYRAKQAQTCLPRVDGVCGPVSAATSDVVVPDEICVPREFDGVAGDAMVTLRWEPEDDATEYQVEQEGVADLFSTTGQHFVICRGRAC